jgi:quinol monooxygenase YgiN
MTDHVRHVTVIAIADLFGIAAGRAELLALFADVQRDAATQAGCERYAFSEALDEPDHFTLISEWRDMASLEAHYASSAFGRFQHALHGLLARPSEMIIYSVSGSIRPLPSGLQDPRDAD